MNQSKKTKTPKITVGFATGPENLEPSEAGGRVNDAKGQGVRDGH